MTVTLEQLIGVRSVLAGTVEDYMELITRKAGDSIPRFYPEHLHKDNAAFEILSHKLRFKAREASDSQIDRGWPHTFDDVGLDESASNEWSRDRSREDTLPAMAGRPSIRWGTESWRQFRRLLILGGPHSGKTWLLLSQAQGLARTQQRLLSERKIGLNDAEFTFPLLVRLKDAVSGGLLDMRSADAFHVLLQQSVPRAPPALVDFARDKSVRGSAVLLLDGFSDVAIERQHDLAGWLKRFVDELEIRHMLVTSRSSERVIMLLSWLETLEIESLDDQQIAEFSRKWYSRCDPSPNQFEENLRLSAHMRQWVQLPSILAVMCHTYAGQQFPERVSRLCERCLSRFLAISYQSRGMQTGNTDELLELVRKVALRLLEEAGTGSYSESQMRDAVRAAQFDLPSTNRFHNQHLGPLLETIQDYGLLVVSGGVTTGNEYRFLAPILCDYLAALELGTRGEPGVALAMQHLYDPLWRHVLRLLGGTLRDSELAEQYVRDLAEANDDLFCHPLKTAIYAAFEAGGNNETMRRLLEVIVDHYLNLPEWFPDSWKPHDGAWVNRTIPDLLLTRRGNIGELLLTKLKESTDYRTSAAAIDVLAERRDTYVVPALTDWLQALDARNRFLAIEALTRIGGMATLNTVITSLRHPDYFVRHAGLQVLIKFRPPADVRTALTPPLLYRLAHDVHPEVRSAVAILMSSVEIHDHKVLKLLLNDRDSTVVVSAVNAAQTQQARELIAEVRELGRQTDRPDITAAAAGCLGKLRDRSSYDVLLDLLKHKNPRVRAAAAGALRNTSCGRAMQQVRAWLSDCSDSYRRGYAIEALARIGGGEVARELVPHLKEADQASVRLVAEQLGELADDAVPELASCVWQHSSDPLSYVDALIAIGSQAAARALINLLETADELNLSPAVLSHIVMALGQLHALKARPILEELLVSPHKELRGAAARSLAEIGGLQVGSATETIVNMLGDPHGACRRDAAIALAVLDRHWFDSMLGIDALKSLRLLLEDDAPGVRAAAARTLGLMEDENAIATLMTLLTDDEPTVVAAARIALERIADVEMRALPVRFAPDSLRQWHFVFSHSVKSALRQQQSVNNRVSMRRSRE